MVSYISIDNATLAYRLTGPACPSTPLIITLHGGRGFGDHTSDFQAFSPLSDDNYRVLSFDYRGHGLSSRTGPYTFAQLVDDVEALRLHFSNDKPIILIAGSFGGFLAQQYAITYPDNVSHLILRGTAPSHHRISNPSNASSSLLLKPEQTNPKRSKPYPHASTAPPE
jgi:pimeloyl-ACP methyl ester carboxylesterase